jgi:RHS repeat-associated protein
MRIVGFVERRGLACRGMSWDAVIRTLPLRASVGYGGQIGQGSRLPARRPDTAVGVRVPERRWVVVGGLLLLLGLVFWLGLAGERPVGLRAGHTEAAHAGGLVNHGLSSLPLAAQGVVSSTLGSGSTSYRVNRVGDGFDVANPAQRLRARFGRGSVRVFSDGVRLGLRVGAVGYGGSLVAVEPVVPRAEGNRVTYARSGLSEWYANGPLGLEQGFTLARAPVGHTVGPLSLSLVLSGDGRASVDANGRGLTLVGPGGASLRYDDLLATDAAGRGLHSWMTVGPGRVVLHVDTRGARYPLRIDPLIQQGSTLTGGTEESGDGSFGSSVALSSDGNTAVVGAPGDSSEAGAVWVFTRSEGRWSQQGKKLTGGAEESGKARFGSSVALSSDGNTAVVGAPDDNSEAGAVWVFTRSEGKWTQQGKKLTGGEEEKGKARLGSSVALSSDGNTVVVGAPGDSSEAGAVWVFTRSEGKWTQQGKKLAGGAEESGKGSFGSSVALSSEGSTALVGAPDDNSEAGAVWVFTRSEGTWSQQGKKLAGGAEEKGKARFGSSVALSSEGSTALVGAPYDSIEAGAVWVFTRSEGTWSQQGKKLTDGEALSDALFGSSVALSSDGNTALIGGPGGGIPNDAMWTFTRVGGNWASQGVLTAGAGEPHFGTSLALSSDGSTVLVGGPNESSGVGAAWVFVNVPGPEEQYGSGSNPAAPNLRRCECGKPVDNATGNETEQQTDISIGGRGPGLRVVRSYNALVAAEAKEAGPWGYGWTGPYDASLAINNEKGTATVHQENGSVAVFYKNGEAFTQAAWTQARLVKEGTNYIYTLPNQTKLEFNSEGRLTKETERNGNSNTFTYNVSHQLEKVTDGDGRTLTFKYNGEGLVESIKDPMGHVVSYTYSEKQLASVTIEGKERWKFEYESPHLLKKITDGRGHSTTIKYEATTHRVTEEAIGGHTRKWKYGTNETTLTEPNGSETVEAFNGAGEPTKITRAKGKSEETTAEYEYEPSTYALIKMINGDKHEWKYGYEVEGNKASETDPNGDEWKWEYDTRHDVIKETAPDGETTTINRNSDGEPEVVERPVGTETQKTEYKYDEKGDVTEIIEPLSNKTKFTYDAAGDKEVEIRARGEEYKWKYNSDSQATEEIGANGFVTKIEPNEQGLPLKVTDPMGHTTEYKYDGDENVESVTDANNHTTKYTYNEENLPTKVEEANKDTVETEYDSEGEMTARKDGDGHKWEYKRNALEQIAEEKNPLGKTWKRIYEKAGNLEKLEDPEKHTTEYSYDESSRLKKIKYSTGKPSEVTYEYNKDSRVTKMTDQTGTTENTYDKLDRLIEYKNGAGKTVKYEYDLANLPTKITYPNGEYVTRKYRQNYRLGEVIDSKGNATTFEYYPDGGLEQIHYPSPSGTQDCTLYSRNEDEQVTAEEFRDNECSTLVAEIDYERGNDGEIKKTTTTGLPGPEVNEDTYDESNRLIEANKKAYEYDKANNPTKIEGTSGYTYNEASQLEKGGGNSYTYNEDGQRAETKPSSGPATTYSYDQAGNLTAVKRPKEGETSEINDTYTYDGNNLRQTQTINGTKANLTWDTAEPTPVVLEDETNSYIYGPEDLPIEQISKTGTIHYLHTDQQGSVRFLTNTNGETEAAYTYSPYGKLEASTGTATTPLRYDGQYTSTDTGLIYLRARTYDPQTAQFLSVDPALQSTDEPYAYTKDNPLNNLDLTGQQQLAQQIPGGQSATGTFFWLCIGGGVAGGLLTGFLAANFVTWQGAIGGTVLLAPGLVPVAVGVTVGAVVVFLAVWAITSTVP